LDLADPARGGPGTGRECRRLAFTACLTATILGSTRGRSASKNHALFATNQFKVIALRDLARYVDASKRRPIRSRSSKNGKANGK